MRKLRCILFVALTAAVLLSVIGYGGLGAAGVFVIPESSSLEGRTYTEVPELTPEAVTYGDYQDEAESYIADHVPVRDNVMLANAALQRTCIKAASVPFSWPCYPTYFDSAYLDFPAYGAVVEAPARKDDVNAELLDSVTTSLAQVISNNQQVNWRFALVDRPQNSQANPAHGLVSDPADYAYFSEVLQEKLQDACPLINLSIRDRATFFERYFKTDHHWSIAGALAAYSYICGSLGEPLGQLPSASTQYAGPFFGSASRAGLLDEYSDSISDVDVLPDIKKVTVDGRRRGRAWLNERYSPDYAGYSTDDRFANAYASYFHGDAGFIDIESKGGKGSLLIIGDSYTNCIDYLFANRYSHVYVIDPRYYGERLSFFLSKHEVDDAVFMISSNDLVTEEMLSFLIQ